MADKHVETDEQKNEIVISQQDKVVKAYQGSRYTIIHCDGAYESFYDVLKTISPAKKQKSLEAQMMAQIKRLADGERMSKENFPSEGKLNNEIPFYALKKIPIRGYCWKSSKYKNTYFISHYTHKKKNKLSALDKQKIQNKWNDIER